MEQTSSKTSNLSATLWALLFMVCFGLTVAHLTTAVLNRADHETGLIEDTFTQVSPDK
jgi:hypothetical protein